MQLALPVQDNIVVSSQGRALITDFGCSLIEFASRTMAQITSGDKDTNLYWAPELLYLVPVAKHSKETDVCAFGITVYVSLLAVIQFDTFQYLRSLTDVRRK